MRRRVLYVDDDLTNLELFRLHFDAEFDVSLCNNPLEAVDLIKELDTPLVVTDYKMPEMNGMDLVREIKKDSPKTVCVLLSAYLDELIEINGEILYDFVSKPYDIRGMVRLMKDAIEHFDARNSSLEA